MTHKKAEDREPLSSSSSDSGSDDEQQGEETQKEEQQAGDGSQGSSRYRQSRNERKARKAVMKLGMKPMPDIVKVVIRKAKQVKRKHNFFAFLLYFSPSFFLSSFILLSIYISFRKLPQKTEK